MRRVARDWLFISRICAVFLVLIALLVSTHSLPASPLQEHRLQRYHTHTGERLDIVYRRGGTLNQSFEKVDELIHIGRRMRRIALESAVGGMVLSGARMLFAACGLLSPLQEPLHRS